MRQCPSLPFLWLGSAGRLQAAPGSELTPLVGDDSAVRAVGGSHTFTGSLLYLPVPVDGPAISSSPKCLPSNCFPPLLHSCSLAALVSPLCCRPTANVSGELRLVVP